MSDNQVSQKATHQESFLGSSRSRSAQFSRSVNRKVSRSALIMWLGYVWGTTLAGLAIHPYQSIRRIVLTKRILLPVTLSPVIGLIGLFVVGRVGSYAFTLGDMGRELMALLLGSTLVGVLMWQGLLLLLVWRFWRARLR